MLCDAVSSLRYYIYLSLFVSVWISFSVDKVISAGMKAACAFKPSNCHFAMVVLLLLSFQKMICVLVSEEGVLHNRQIWPEAWRAAKLSVLIPQITLMWNNLVFCLWCFSSRCAVVLLSYHLSYPELTSKYTLFSQAHHAILYISFVFILQLFGLWLVACTYLVFFCFTLCVSCLSASQCLGS